MSIVEFLPREYGYVTLVLVLYCLVNSHMAMLVAKARKRFNVPYPTLYASESENKNAKIFNCIQRGHQHSLELMPIFMGVMIIGGFKHPCICASLGFLYTLSRFFFFKNYATGEPHKRIFIGRFGFLALFGLMACTISLGITLLRG